MFNKFNIAKSATDLEISEQFVGYSRVVLEVSDDISYEAGTATGRTLTMACPWGTQKMANSILNSIRGYQYQPYNATGAILDPSAEVGDAVQISGAYGGVYDTDISFGKIPRANVSAPSDEEVDESTPYKSVSDRKIERQKLEMKAQFEIQAGLISAKVSKTGGEDSNFGWELDEKSWTLKSDSSVVLTADKNGLEIKGIIRATGGEIGGFTIEKDYLSYNNQTWDGSNTRGAYLGTKGLQLGKKFKVDMQGNLTASSGTFSGTVYAGKISYGGSAGTVSGSAISAGSIYGGSGGQLSGSTLSNYNLSGGINTSLGYADYANGVFNEYNQAKVVYCSSIRMGTSYFHPVTIYYTDNHGSATSITVLANKVPTLP